ncbi:sulfotransferase [Okeania sp.]|uniref:sulfotransferase family protein n=1 Tax=Okeania sp. TaxID=3100323 RepID=UPI002B4B257D|nr:sulfotransferase [Okeania sp.]MEB3342538.1 sulfotransferase [Okeania sp.]
MKQKLQAPIFLFGCPRSGTTLLQSLLATHPAIASFPETKFFFYGIGKNRKKLGLISRHLKQHLNQYFKNEINRPEMLEYFPKIPLLDLYTRSFIKVLNILTLEEGKSVWLEKTPEHLLSLDYIEKMLPEARMIHILRNGSDVVASLYEVTHKYPQEWHKPWDIDFCLKRWKESIEISLKHSHKSNHILVNYEELVVEPAAILKKICDFLNVEFEERMIADYGKVAKYLSSEKAGRRVSGKIKKSGSDKFNKIFNEFQKQYILDSIYEFNLELLKL